MFSFVFILKD